MYFAHIHKLGFLTFTYTINNYCGTYVHTYICTYLFGTAQLQGNHVTHKREFHVGFMQVLQMYELLQYSHYYLTVMYVR